MYTDNFVRTKIFCALLHTLDTRESSATIGTNKNLSVFSFG